MAAQRWEFDFTELDLFNADKLDQPPSGRPTIVFLRDKYTRFVLGFTISDTYPAGPSSHISPSSFLYEQDMQTEEPPNDR